MRLKTLDDDTFDDFGVRSPVSTGTPLHRGERDAARVTTQSFADLYRRQAPKLLRYFARRVGNEDARDLVQEAFAGFMGAAARQPRNVERPEAYLSTIAHNLVAKRTRTAVRRSTALHVSTDDAPLTGPDPQAHLEARDVLDRLETAMLRLPPMTRQIFMAHRLDGYTYREIAERTGFSVKRVEKHMSRAIARLDDILGRGR
jgi:RNA polymerase sigma-70 factor (ECF subfamily)